MKTKSGKLVENADLWQEIKEALAGLEERTAHNWWTKVHSHMDIEGNEQADMPAKEGVCPHLMGPDGGHGIFNATLLCH